MGGRRRRDQSDALSASPGASPARVSLRELATLSPEEISRAVKRAAIGMDPDEIAAWEGTLGDGLDE